MYNQSLPSLDLLVPFEAAARLGSFTRAAEELNVTQSAVSQRVRNLEDQLGVALFERAHRRIKLTVQGREMLNGVTAALQHLLAATQSVRRSDAAPRVRIAADTSIATFWLMPRLAAFQRLHSGIAIDLTTSDDEAICLGAEIAILHGAGSWLGFDSTKLFDDEIFPVCAPSYLKDRTLDRPEHLLGVDLIDLDYIHWNWMNWSIWLTETGVDPSTARRVMQSNSYAAVIDAAKRGQGVALGWRHFIDDALAQGTLIRPMSDQVTTRFGYYIALYATAGDEARALAAWLAQSVQP